MVGGYKMNSSKVLDLSNNDVYYGNEANWKYWSVSQYKDFMSCEAAALAKLKDDWQPIRDPKALLVGNYVHSHFESPQAHQSFLDAHSDKLYKKDGNLYKDFEVADQMITRVEEDKFFKFLWQGEKETVVTGELYGVEWKGKIDLLNIEKGYFVDLKTTRDINLKVWDTYRRQYVSFVEGYGYDIQLGVYERLLEQEYGKSFEGYIYAVSKQTPSNIQAIKVPEVDKEIMLNQVEEKIKQLNDIKNGSVQPEPCGHCEFCRGHKQLNNFVYSHELIG